MTIFHCHVVEGRYVVCMTTNALDHIPVPRASFEKPSQAAAYARMRQADVQPIRSSVEPSGPSFPEVSAEQPRGRSTGAHPPV